MRVSSWLSALFLLCIFLMNASRVQSVVEGSQTPKIAWPELLGLSVGDARAKVLAERPDLSPENVVVHAADAMVTMDYRVNRVRIFVDKEDKVSSPPRVG